VTDSDDSPSRRDEDCFDVDPDGPSGPLLPDGICDCIDVNFSGTCFDNPNDDPDLGVVDLPASGPPDGASNWTALRAAYYAERLYTPLVNGQPGSSVQTFMIGYGGAFSGGCRRGSTGSPGAAAASAGPAREARHSDERHELPVVGQRHAR
jgi:hypothetical protein